MLFEALSSARDLGRLQEIARVLAGHGLGDTVRRLGLAKLLERAGEAVNVDALQDLSKEPQVRLREAFEELGPTFVKLGQLLAGRPDLLPPSWTQELARLREHVQPVAEDVLYEQLVEDLGRPPEEVFERFERSPLAAASIAQIHRAQLADGTHVVLKVRRPDIVGAVEADLRLLARLAERAEEHLPELRRFRPRGLVRSFARSLREELDLRIEAQNTRRMRELQPPDEGIVVPRVFGDWGGERLCVLEYLEGQSVGAWLEGPEHPAEEGRRLAARGADAVLRSIFVDGVFHADPHHGNLLVLPDGHLGVLDFGMLGVLTEARRMELLELLIAFAEQDAEAIVRLLANWSYQRSELDRDQLTQDCTALLARYGDVELGELDAGNLLSDLVATLRENDLLLPADVALLLKSFVLLEGVARDLDPEFVLARRAAPFARQAARRHASPAAVAKRGARELQALMRSLPRDLRQAGQLIREGRVGLDLELGQLGQFGDRLDRSANRLTLGMITAALIVGTAIAMTVPGGPEVLGLPVFGLLGFLSSVAAGLWVVWSVVRSGRG